MFDPKSLSLVTWVVCGSLVAAPATKPSATRPSTRPTTRPLIRAATRPAAKPIVDRDWVPIEAKNVGFRFRTPKNWRQMQVSSNFLLVAFTLIPEKSRAKATDAQFEVRGQIPCHDGASTLEERVAMAKASALNANPEAQFAKDEAVKVGDVDAWLLEYDSLQTVVDVKQVDGKSVRTETKFKRHVHHVLTVKDNKTFEVQMEYDPGAATGNMAVLMMKVLGTFEWVSPT